MTLQGSDLHVFVVRVRREPREIAGAPVQWTFWIEHHPTGTQHYYRNFAGLLDFIAEYLPADAMESGALPPAK